MKLKIKCLKISKIHNKHNNQNTNMYGMCVN